MLERTATDLLRRLGIDERLNREGLLEEGFALADSDRLIRIGTFALTGKHVTVYGQTKVTRDLIDAAPARGLEIVWEAVDVALHDLESDAPYITWAGGRLDCDFIAGCDGFHGVSRKSIPASVLREFGRVYPFGWLGILADVPPCHHELIYASHDRGFALASMGSASRSRYYVQVPVDEDVALWPDERLWDELAIRLGPEAAAGITRGPALEKSIAPLRSFVSEPMHHRRLFLAGDSANIVPQQARRG